jgi:transposase
MKRFVQGDNRTQSFLLPEALDDYVTDTNPVRVVDVFVDELDLQKLGFEGVEPALTGRPSYHPEVMLKICKRHLKAACTDSWIVSKVVPTK